MPRAAFQGRRRRVSPAAPNRKANAIPTPICSFQNGKLLMAHWRIFHDAARIDQAPISADRAFELGVSTADSCLDQIDRKFGCFANCKISETTRA